MSKITEIKVAKGAKSRRHIYIDDVFTCTLDEFSVYKYKLREGLEISIPELEQITYESEANGAFLKAVNLISRTPKTKKQMYDYLKSKGYMPKLCNHILQKLIAYRYIDDEQYATSFVNTYKAKYGKKKLQYELLGKGVSPQIIDAVLSQLEPQVDTIEHLARKYMRNKEQSPQNYAKLCRHLASKGFGWSEINAAVNKIKENNYENWD